MTTPIKPGFIFLVLSIAVAGGYYKFMKRHDYPIQWRTEGMQLRKLNQICLALEQYSQKYGRLPPPYTVDQQGNRLHSWRTLLLPYYGEPYKSLYEKIDLSKPWDSPENAKVNTDIYFAGKNLWNPDGVSHLAIIGPESAWEKLDFNISDHRRDEASGFLLIAEVKDSGIPWAAPRDIELDQIGRNSKIKPMLVGVGVKNINGRLPVPEKYIFRDLEDLKKQATFKRSTSEHPFKELIRPENKVRKRNSLGVL